MQSVFNKLEKRVKATKTGDNMYLFGREKKIGSVYKHDFH